MVKRRTKGQEEMVGFVVIVIIVSIILVFFLLFSLSSKTEIQSYKAESFLQSALQYTTTCENSYQYLSIQNLVLSCYDQELCADGRDSCLVLNETLKGILNQSWPVGPDFPTKGYNLDIFSDTQPVISIQEGNKTGVYQGAQQVIPKGPISINVVFTAYS